MTKEEREAKCEAKKQERAAKRAAILEQKKAKAEAKKLKREEKKAKRLAQLEKQKAKKAAIRQKKREAREAKRAKELAKKQALKEKKLALKNAKMLSKKQKKTIVNDGSVDIKDAAKMMKKALKQIAAEFAGYDSKKLDKKSKAIAWLGYEVNVEDGNVIVNFNASKSKKLLAFEQPKANDVIVPEVDDSIDDSVNDEDQPKEKEEVEMVPAGDLYATDGEVANIDVDDEANLDDDEDDVDNDNDNSMIDHRDETDEDLVEARREFFGNFGDDGGGYND